MKVSIKVHQELDKCGDEFLNDRDFTAVVDIPEDASCEWIWFEIPDLMEHDLCISKNDFTRLAKLILG